MWNKTPQSLTNFVVGYWQQVSWDMLTTEKKKKLVEDGEIEYDKEMMFKEKEDKKEEKIAIEV